MGADITVDEILTHKHKRNFIQFGGASPINVCKYAGQDAQYLAIEGVTVPEQGGIDPMFVHDPRFIGKYKMIGRTISPPDLATATVIIREKHGAIPRQLLRHNCPFNLYEVSGICDDLSDFNGWSDYVLIYSGAYVTDKDGGNRSGFDSDDAVEDTLSITLMDVYPVGTISFVERAATQIDREVVDTVYAPLNQCANCDPGDERIYAVTTPSGAGSPGLPAELVYTLDKGLTMYQQQIDSFGASEVPYAIDFVGKYLVVLGADAYFYATVNPNTGVPDTFTKVTTGFVAAGSPKDMYVINPREVIFVGDGGYIYKSTDITQGVSVISAASVTAENLLRVKGHNDVIVAVGAAGTVLKSSDKGVTWAACVTYPTASQLQAVEVVTEAIIWVGSVNGYMWYSMNGGESWVNKSFAGEGAGQIRDIHFPTSEVGFMSYSTSTPTARLYATWNGGANWVRNSDTTPRIINWPTFDSANRFATPNTNDAGVNCNNLAVAGLGGNGVDGILLIGQSEVM